MNKAGQATAAPPKQGVFAEIFGPIGKLFGGILKYLILFLVIAIIIILGFLAYRFFVAKQQTGEVASTVVHGQVAVEEASNPFKSWLKANSPDYIYTVFYPGEYNPYAIDSVVETSIDKDLGVRIVEFKPIIEFFRPNSRITLMGKIQAESLSDKPIEILAFCSLDGYKDKEPIPALLLGFGASGNKGTVYKDRTAEFQVQCVFPEGLTADKPVISKTAKLIVTYDFTSKAYQRIWVLNKVQLDDFLIQGSDPFEIFNVNDPLLNDERKTTSVTTPGPIKLGLAVDFPQPLTELTEYLMLVQPSRTAELGNLEKLNYLKVKVPAVQDLDIQLSSETGGFELGSFTECDFEYVGEAPEPGYKEFQLVASKLEDTNKECNDKTLKELAITENDCIKYYKEPLFLCSFRLTKAPATLQSDTIRAEANYVYKVEKQSVVDIKTLPSQLASQPVG